MAGLALIFALMNFLIVYLPKLCERKSQMQVVIKEIDVSGRLSSKGEIDGLQNLSSRETTVRFSERSEAK